MVNKKFCRQRSRGYWKRKRNRSFPLDQKGLQVCFWLHSFFLLWTLWKAYSSIRRWLFASPSSTDRASVSAASVCLMFLTEFILTSTPPLQELVQAYWAENEATIPKLNSGRSLLTCHLTLAMPQPKVFFSASSSCSTHIYVSAPAPKSFQLLVALNGTACTSNI